ncbi:polyketide synthase [Aspergillus eucalypticola CBS 122712]|uniref:Polyketide synthase n=1 Tax=Aspergillus eucalypticola (strain CBS 122712 / IBT 29274) TaxID=1448314 RepID=A0A317WGN6_ASPEC|nr:polyketide synthase [Aspergillus eucalypticola CBS 122712]PWY84422.1 polyketide synthase [Aspergillus eucalypticola CBS 122712]
MPSRENGLSGSAPNPGGEVNDASTTFSPIAICGMALRLPGGLGSPQDLWDFLIAKGDARSRVPESRYNVSAFHSPSKRPGTVVTEYGYFLDESIKLGALDASRFSLSRAELEAADPQQRQMLEVVRECFDDAGEANFRAQPIGCYMGCYGEDWLELQSKDPQQNGMNRVDGYSDFMLSNRVSYEMDLRGPSITIRTACSSALVGLNEACLALQRGDCDAAVVGGSSLIFAPATTAFMTEKGVLSPDGSCKTFSADANGYARGEAITAVFVKPLAAALRDGNPVRAVIRSVMSNSDGKTPGIAHPSTDSQEALIRKAYRAAGITNMAETAFVECHGTGTPTGDPVETLAVARVFGDAGVYIGSVKPNLGHSEGASGLTSLIKGVLALENRIIPPNIKFTAPNPKIPFEACKLTVPLDPTPWPESRWERVSINSFGVGGSNAHLILDSARSFQIPSPTPDDFLAGPQLLLLSASVAGSLQRMTETFENWVPQHQDQLCDLAYTLATRREHLQHRSFLIAGPDRVVTPSPGRKVPTSAPSLAMVFTGQGAQWARMGRDLLLRSDFSFQNTIRALDKYLKAAPNGPEWRLEEELLKPALTSRVQTAELSQPLCTAVQIGLVDLFAAVGVTPAAVVGHSSGEIGAAYAAGALTAREAIIAAWQRGLAAAGQTRPGAMAAIGLGWEEVQSFLSPPTVVVACENSPKSVTLSGDTQEVQAAVARIKKEYPTVTARLLKVDKAYHSYHMREVGTNYSTTIGRDLVGRRPGKLFFSSVTGKQEQDLPLDAAYWQRNLESPVLFRAAVSELLDHVDNVAFLEIGPHAALAGPVRQILTARSSSNSAPYIAAMSRGENCVESFLTALGKLFQLNFPVNLNALYPSGSCLPGLPRYPWDHGVDYWRESRISRDWRFRQFASHPLLGDRQLLGTDLEPSWRSMMRVEDSGWLRDHKVEVDIILPCAGYLSMVGEAIRQISGSQGSYTLRGVVISSALVLREGTPTEVVTTFHPHRLTDSLDSQWWEFTIASYNGQTWTKHCTGQASGTAAEEGQTQTAALRDPLPRKLQSKKYYDLMDRAGLNFGPMFKRLTNIETGTRERLARAKVTTDQAGDETYYHLHPTIIDACIQAAPLAGLLGTVDAKAYRRVPTKIDRVIVRQTPTRIDDLQVSASATCVKGTGEVIGQVQQCIADGTIVMHMEGLKLSPLEEAGEAGKTDGLETTARLTWGPHIDFLDASTLIKPSFPRHLYTPALDELARLGMIYGSRRIKDASTPVAHMPLYRDWMNRQVEAMRLDEKWSTFLALEDEALVERIERLVQHLSETPVVDCAIGLQKVATNIAALFTGETEALDILLADDTLYKLYVVTDACDRSQFIQHLAHTKPNLRILEIGAGTGATTASILKLLRLPGSTSTSSTPSLFSKYTYTDISSGFFVTAKERLSGESNIEYRTLDISKDPSEQGFDGEKYDLILATNVLHATNYLGETLRNVHKLLDPNGRLLLHELNSPSKWPNFIFGTLAGWWYGGPDGRPDEPCVSPARWESELKGAGFAGLDAVVLDGEQPHQLNAIMVAKPRVDDGTDQKRTVSLLCDPSDDSYADSLSRRLNNRGYEVQTFRLGDELPQSQDIISLLDCTRPFFEDIDAARFAAFQHLLNTVIGAARSIRSEMLVDFATCEVDDIRSSLDKIIDVYSKFHTRAKDESLNPDYEYTIVGGTVSVGRIFPFSLKDDLAVVTEPDDWVALDMEKPSRLSSLHWKASKGRPLAGDEVEVEIYAAGLNFKDVLGALAVVPFPDNGLGVEASGIVRHVGPDVKRLCPGDRVMLREDGTFATHAIASEKLCAKIPSDLSFEDAATMPVVFATAIYSMFDLGGLQEGQSILIHSACGGVGIAAIQLARMAGATIYATVGSEEKVKYLMETYGLPRNRIFNSHDSSFVEGVMRETQGQGVDLALNSLSGELLHATWLCLAEFGKMVDIGKRDMLGAARLDMGRFLGSRTYSCFYLDLLRDKRPSECKRLLELIMTYFRAGHITPISPITTFNASAIEDAFRHMQQGTHLGKLVILLRNADGSPNIDPTLVKTATSLDLDSTASYLMIGGLGGLGRAVSRRLVEHKARCLVFLSRSAGLGLNDDDFVRELESMGCDVRLVQGSVTNEADVKRAIQQAPNLKGVLQLSMVLRDQAFPHMTLAEWNTAVAPKIQGTWHLHNATQDAGITLDFFVLFSSTSGVLGLPGQANYAGANTFLDAFVQYRTRLGLAASAVDIGAVQDIGYVAEDDALLQRLKQTGAHHLTESELLEAVLATMSLSVNPNAAKNVNNGLGFVDKNNFILGLRTSVPLSSPESRVFWRKDRRMALYHNSVAKTNVPDVSSDGDTLQTFLARTKSDPYILRSGESASLLAREIGNKLFNFLLKTGEDLNTSLPLSQLGMDSLVGVEMRSWWRQAFGFDITVLEMMGLGNLEGLGKHAAEGLAKLLGIE